MKGHRDPWALPGPRRWLDEVSRRVAEGLAVIETDPSRPPDMMDALRDVIGRSATEIRAKSAELPAAELADAFGTAPTLDSLLNPGLDQELGVLLLGDAGSDMYDRWKVFLQRFADARAEGRAGPCILVVDPPSGISMPPGCTVKGWRNSLCRGDARASPPSSRWRSRSNFALGAWTSQLRSCRRAWTTWRRRSNGSRGGRNVG